MTLLTVESVAGRRRRFTGSVRLFLVASALAFARAGFASSVQFDEILSSAVEDDIALIGQLLRVELALFVVGLLIVAQVLSLPAIIVAVTTLSNTQGTSGPFRSRLAMSGRRRFRAIEPRILYGSEPGIHASLFQ